MSLTALRMVRAYLQVPTTWTACQVCRRTGGDMILLAVYCRYLFFNIARLLLNAGDCADDAPDLVAGGLISFYQASLNRACSDLVEDIGSLGHWAEENITFRDNVGLQDDHSVSTGRSVHAMDGSHKTFGCNSTLARFMQLLDQSGAIGIAVESFVCCCYHCPQYRGVSHSTTLYDTVLNTVTMPGRPARVLRPRGADEHHDWIQLRRGA